MLVYLFTDAALAPAVASDLLHHAVERSFNRISIDGDTSTNDTVLLLASGASGVTIQGHSHDTAHPVDDPPTASFSSALRACAIARHAIVEDGEGIHHVVELKSAEHSPMRMPSRSPPYCPLSPGQDRVGGLRSQLGPHTGGHRLCRRSH